jgi:glutamyl-tRNA(Gln) amidotransferase subunit E
LPFGAASFSLPVEAIVPTKIPLFFSILVYIGGEMVNYGIDIEDNSLFESLGFKCGLEIHQQVATEKKLFCHCPVGLTKRKYDAEILRHMRPTLSELGEYDGTALMEFKTKKEVIYRLYRDRTCTYEMDDTPPFLVNQQAVDFAIQLALLFNCRIVDEIHVIRKQYLDGSIPTGFQRTMIIGVDGWVPYKDRKITITQVNLEEEACREVSDIGHRITYATDRLSIPLVEIITGSDMRNPTEAAEVCRLLGNSMKITGLVRRGIGTVRQDVNVSITGGTRVEIKGVYKVGNIKPLTAIEALRQKGLLELKELFPKRFGAADKIAYAESNLTPSFSGTKNIIGHRLESDTPLKVVGLYLPDLADIINFPLQPNWNFGSELGGRVRVIACIDSKPNLFFYSRKDKYDIPEQIWNEIRGLWNFGPNDDIVVICGPSADVVTAISEIKIRISELAIGVVNETRQDMKDGTTDFERILPGPDRMYPDTDHPPVRISAERVAEDRKKVGEPLWEKQRRWSQMGLGTELVAALSLSTFAPLFDRLAAEKSINIRKAAHICTGLMTGLRRKGYRLAPDSQSKIHQIILSALRQDWPYGRLKEALIALASNEPVSESPVREPDEAIFEKSWREAEQTFIPSENNTDHEKFRRFVIGRLLEKYPAATCQIIERVGRKLAIAK